MFPLLLLTSLLLGYLCYKLSRRHTEKCADTIPGDKGYPFFGNALDFLFNVKDLSDLMPYMRKITDKYHDSGMMKVWFGPKLWVYVWEPKYIEALVDSNHAHNKGRFLNQLCGDLFGGAWAVDGGAKWRELRKPLLKVLGKKLLDNDYYKVFVRQTRSFTQFLRSNRLGKEFNVLHDLYHLTTDIFSETHLGVTTDEVNNPHFMFLENLDHYVEFSISSMVRNPVFFVKGLANLPRLTKKIEQTKNDICDFLQWIFDQRTLKASKGENGDYEMYTDFLLRRASERSLTKEDIQKELIDVVVGGTETSSITMASCLLFLGMFPDVQELVYQEQLKIFGDDLEREPTVEDINRMEYLTRVIKETLRHISAACLFRNTSNDVQIDNYWIPKDTLLFIFMGKAQKDPKHWEFPDKFYPDHFLPEREAERPTYSYFPFGFGQRLCPGIHYAMNAMRVVLSGILRNFRVSTRMDFEKDMIYYYKIMRQLKIPYSVTFQLRAHPEQGI